MLGEIVTTYGYEALPTPSAKDAIATLAKGRTYLIFVDLRMPDVTGNQLLISSANEASKRPWW